MTNTPSRSRQIHVPTLKQFLTRLLLLVALATLLGLATSHTQPTPAPAPAPAALSGDLVDEVWWTTTDCPAGVQVPCLDPTVEGAPGLPVEVAAQVERHVDAQWQCLDQVGRHMQVGPQILADAVYVTDEQLAQCRQYAYIATQA